MGQVCPNGNNSLKFTPKPFTYSIINTKKRNPRTKNNLKSETFSFSHR